MRSGGCIFKFFNQHFTVAGFLPVKLVGEGGGGVGIAVHIVTDMLW